MLVRYGRVKLAEEILEAVGAECVVLLIGERPGGDAQAARSLSAYLVRRRGNFSHDPSARPAARSAPACEYWIVSNIHAAGLPPLEAGAVIAERVLQILADRGA
jgi:ethanolamine ammonia-lyase large subunit